MKGYYGLAHNSWFAAREGILYGGSEECTILKLGIAWWSGLYVADRYAVANAFYQLRQLCRQTYGVSDPRETHLSLDNAFNELQRSYLSFYTFQLDDYIVEKQLDIGAPMKGWANSIVTCCMALKLFQDSVDNRSPNISEAATTFLRQFLALDEPFAAMCLLNLSLTSPTLDVSVNILPRFVPADFLGTLVKKLASLKVFPGLVWILDRFIASAQQQQIISTSSLHSSPRYASYLDGNNNNSNNVFVSTGEESEPDDPSEFILLSRWNQQQQQQQHHHHHHHQQLSRYIHHNQQHQPAGCYPTSPSHLNYPTGGSFGTTAMGGRYCFHWMCHRRHNDEDDDGRWMMMDDVTISPQWWMMNEEEWWTITFSCLHRQSAQKTSFFYSFSFCFVLFCFGPKVFFFSLLVNTTTQHNTIK